MKHFKQPNRQFSNTSSTYSNQTQQSSQSNQSAQSAQSSSSVIINKLADDDTKHSLNNVLDYINKVDEFNPNDLYLQRQQRKFVTKFGTSYHQKSQSAEDFTSNSSNTKSHNLQFGDGFDADGDDEDYEESLNGEDDLEDIPNRVAILEDHPLTSLEPKDDYDDDDDMLLPPSPPRSPPKELDPDKLYGLYDFSGPDPSHCSITRNEPVFLINDQDNYWWLIKKLTKDQRKQLLLERSRNFEDDYSDVETDEEDGKVGFVPAECLETHGERLARLNCFKNEELERSSRDLLIKLSNPSSSPSVDNITENKSFSSIGLGSPANFQKSPDTTLSRSGSILRDPNTTKQSINKSVTFEDLSVMENEDEEEMSGNILNNLSDDSIKEQQFPEHYYDNLSIPKIEDEEKRSEVMSDIYPSETPLLISKRKDSPMPEKHEFKQSTIPEVTTILAPRDNEDSGVESEVSDHDTYGHEGHGDTYGDEGYGNDAYGDNAYQDNAYDQHSMDNISVNTNSDHERVSVQSQSSPQESPESQPSPVDARKSPQTPQSNYQTPNLIPSSQFQTNSQFDQFKTPNEDTPDNFKTPTGRSSGPSTPHSERIRRSQLLDRLNQVTADIQNELSDYSRELGEDLETKDLKDYDNPYYNQGFLTVFENGSFSSRSALEELPEKEEKKEEDYDSGYDELVNQLEESYKEEGNVTPLTSTNSLTHDLDKRKSKPVHDMFKPILGKFDELAEKLAEIDEML